MVWTSESFFLHTAQNIHTIMKANEIWKDVLGYEGLYQASNNGKIYSKSTKRERSLGNHHTGYLNCCLSKNNAPKTFSVHRLVWEAFNGKIPDGFHVDHIDGDRHNNKLENLQLLTKSENSRKAQLGRKHTKDHNQKISDGIRGSRNPMYGKSHTKETKRKISETLKRKRGAH